MLHTRIELKRINEQESIEQCIFHTEKSVRKQKLKDDATSKAVAVGSDKLSVSRQRNWNRPIPEEGAQSATPDQQVSDPSRSIVPEGSAPIPTPYESVPVPVGQPEVEPPPSAREPGSSRLSPPDDESYALPQHSSSSAPRMIQQSSSGRTASQNAFKRLKSMGSIGEGSEKLPALPPPGDLGQYGYPTTGVNVKKPETHYPGYKTYQVTRCLCCFTTFITVFLVVCAIITILFAIVKMNNDCQAVSVMIVLMDIILLVIVVIEWIRLWIWREPTPLSSKYPGGMKGDLTSEASMGPVLSGGRLPMISNVPGAIANPTYPTLSPSDNPVGGFLSLGFQQRLYDVPQFVSALCLVVLYAIGAVCIFGTMAAAGANMSKCTELGLCGIAFAAVLAILLCMRMVMCCLSDACRGLCHRTASTYGAGQVPMVAINQLHQVLPGMGKNWHSGGDSSGGGSPPTAWLMNLAGASDPRQQLSIIQPMPAQYANDLTR